MENSSEKYRKVVGFLKEAKPQLKHSEISEERIMTAIREQVAARGIVTNVTNILFGWTAITWARRTFVFAAATLLLLIVFQQGRIIRQMSYINTRFIPQGELLQAKGQISGTTLLFLKMSAGRINTGSDLVTKDDLAELISSFDKMSREYNELLRLIRDDPELRQLIEEKLKDVSNSKVKL